MSEWGKRVVRGGKIVMIEGGNSVWSNKRGKRFG